MYTHSCTHTPIETYMHTPTYVIVYPDALNPGVLCFLIGPGRPFDLAVFEDRVWVSDRERRSLGSFDKRSGEKLERIHVNVVQPASIVVVHPMAKSGRKRGKDRDGRKRLHFQGTFFLTF